MDRIGTLIVGAGLAGARCAEALRAGGHDGTILLAGDEPHAPYERPALSKDLLLGRRTAASLAQRPDGFWEEHGIATAWGAPVEGIDLHARRARIGGRELGWERLVIATGARARRLPGLEPLAGVHHLRSLDDALELAGEMSPRARLAVIGAGFIGGEVASSARQLGLDVAMIEEAEVPLARVLGPEVGRRMAGRMREAGVDLRTGTRLRRIVGRGGRVRRIELDDGEALACDLVLVGVGAVPNADLPLAGALARAEDGGLATDARGRTAHPDVFACGDVASAWRPEIGRHARREHWTAASAGARAVAAAILGAPPGPAAECFFWSDQFGWRLQTVGASGPHLRAEIADEAEDGFVVRYRDRPGALCGALTVNRPEGLASLRREMAAAAEGVRNV